MDELEEIKRRKLLELQRKQQEELQRQAEEQQKLEEKIEELEMLVKQYLGKEALQRYGNLKIAHAEKAIKVLAVLGQLINAGKINSQLTDEQFKEILKRLEPPKKDFTIKKA
jgi:programmed cell death protein 5